VLTELGGGCRPGEMSFLRKRRKITTTTSMKWSRDNKTLQLQDGGSQPLTKSALLSAHSVQKKKKDQGVCKTRTGKNWKRRLKQKGGQGHPRLSGCKRKRFFPS